MKSSRIGKRAIVIGAGIGGLSAAGALSSSFEEVVVLERDNFTLGFAPRPGVPQGKHPHLLLSGGLQALDDLFPGFEQDLLMGGAVPVNSGTDVRYEVAGQERLPRRDVGVHTYSMSRPMIEFTIRRRIEQQPNISLRGQCRALEILGTPDGSSVTGVRYGRPDGSSETLSAEVVVDASAHGALSIAFFQFFNRPLPEETVIGVDVRYSSAIFTASHTDADFKIVATLAKAPKHGRGGAFLPAENNSLQIIMGGKSWEDTPRDPDTFLNFAEQLETTTIYERIRHEKRIGDIAFFGFPESTWRHFGKIADFPRGLLPIGDAVCRFNPIHGQGMTVALREANMLRHLLQVRTLDVDPLRTLTQTYVAEVEALVEDPWTMSTIPDFAYSETRGTRPPDLEKRLKSLGALHRVAISDPSVHKLLFETRHLLKPLEVLNAPEIADRVEEEMAAAK